MPIRDYLDVFNSILLDLKNIDVILMMSKAFILLFSLSSSFENFINSMCYSRDTFGRCHALLSIYGTRARVIGIGNIFSLCMVKLQ